jgi:hypothetical protein
MNEKFAFWFRRVTKWLVPIVFFIVALAAYDKASGVAALGGLMAIIVIFAYILEGLKIGNPKV